MSASGYDTLENLPSLKQGWIRLVHRCIMGNGEDVRSIKANGLIFNREAAKCSPYQKGGSYSYPTSMVSVYDEETFWHSMQKDDFACFNNEKSADTKLVFDMPMEEFCFLQSYGKIIKGRIDSKYFVGCVENVNAQNLRLKAPLADVLRASKISKSNLPSGVEPNNMTTLINRLIMRLPKDKREEKKLQIYDKMQNTKAEFLEFFAEEKRRCNKMFLLKSREGR